jgi:hypothetical protein
MFGLFKKDEAPTVTEAQWEEIRLHDMKVASLRNQEILDKEISLLRLQFGELQWSDLVDLSHISEDMNGDDWRTTLIEAANKQLHNNELKKLGQRFRSLNVGLVKCGKCKHCKRNR